MAETEQATRYREIKRLGAGGMAKVILAEDTVLGRQVALKRVYGAGERREMLRLKREALVGASLNHPNLVFVYDAQLQEDGDVVIVMEYVEGETLGDRIRSRGALAPQEATHVLRGVAAALDAIHQRGIVHRDVKPANVLLGRDGTVKLADLGVADVADRTRITESGAVVGSFGYMAAEQLNGAEPSPAMDVYALAAVAYEMLAGEKARPESNPLALAHAISTQPPPDLRRAWPDAPAATAAVLQRAMSADPAKRPPTAGDLVRRLEATFAREEPTREVAPTPKRATPALVSNRSAPASARTAPAAARTRPATVVTARRTPVLVPALLVLAALAVAGVIVAALGSGGKQPSGASTSAGRATARRPATTAATTHSTATHSTATHSTAGATHSTAAHSSTGATHSTPGATGSTPATSLSTPATPGSSAAAPPATSAATPASSGTPANAVERFYAAAALHQYPAAWALADSNLRSQLGGYSAFQNQMSSVRSITFQRAETVAGGDPSSATVALRTTSVQTARTQHCAGTARTVRSGGAWLLDGISISCS